MFAVLYLQQDAADVQVSLQSLVKTPISRSQRVDDQLVLTGRLTVLREEAQTPQGALV